MTDFFSVIKKKGYFLLTYSFQIASGNIRFSLQKLSSLYSLKERLKWSSQFPLITSQMLALSTFIN